MSIASRLRAVVNAFTRDEEVTTPYLYNGGASFTTSSPSRAQRSFSNERTIISSIYTRIAIDAAAIAFRHVQLDENGRFASEIDSPLNDCLTFEPNLDQGPRNFRQDIVMTMVDRGVAAIVPIDTTVDSETDEIVDIYSLRVGEVLKWMPHHVQVSVYNEHEKVGKRQEITLPKRTLGIVENPLYTVMNEINSTYNRLVKKLSFLDAVDEQSASGKLDMIIQLPYVIKSDARRQQAEDRRNMIEMQLKNSKYGIAYTDGTEKVIQLNRPVENNLLTQVEYLMELLYSQLGITKEVMDGTADEQAIINYYNRTIEPIVDAISEAMQRSFLGRARTKKRERIHYYRDPFKLTPMKDLAEIADKLARNEILTSNEIRGVIGFKPNTTDPKADQLINSNNIRYDSAGNQMVGPSSGPTVEDMDSIMDEVFGGLSEDIDKIVGGNG